MDRGEFIVLITLIIILYLTPTIRSQNDPQTKKGPGISACAYYGFLDGFCDVPEVPVDILPEPCTSLFWDGLTVDLMYNVVSSRGQDKLVILEQLLKSGKPVYVYYGHYCQEEWTQMLGCGACDGAINARDEMKGLDVFMKAYPGIKGLVLTPLMLDIYSIDYPGFTENLLAYIKVMRETFPDLEIGIELFAIPVIDYYSAPEIEWLDLKALDPFLDFYTVSTYIFNNCTSEFRVGGTAPVTGNTPYTLTKVHEYLMQACVSSEKLHYSIKLAGTPDDSQLSTCKATYQKICTEPDKTCNFCADTTLSYFEKGQFIKANAGGFIGRYIDYADPYCNCDCGRPFAPFYDILDGYNNKPTPKCCKLMDRQ